MSAFQRLVRVRAWLGDFLFPERGVLRPLPYAGVAAAGIALGCAIASLDLSQRAEWSLYDRIVRVARRDPRPPPDIAIVAIDELSFQQIGVQWPWPRRIHAALIEALAQAGARTIAIDLLFDTPSDPEDDAALARAIDAAGNVILAVDRASVNDRAYSVQQWIEPIAPLAEAAATLGAVGVEFDPDGVLRRTPVVVDGRPTLALAAALEQPGFAPPAAPTEPRLIYFAGGPRQGITTVSYYQALDASRLLPAGFFRGKTVFVGRSLAAASSVEVPEHFATPMSIQMAGVEVHANLFNTLVRGSAIRDPFGSYAGLLGLCVGFGALASVIFYEVGPAAGFIVVLVSFLVLLQVGYVSLASFLTRLPVVAPALTLVAAYGATAAYRFALGTRERRLIKRAFQHYVAPAIVQQMLDEPSRLKLGGEQYDLTVLFADLEGFTTIAEGLTPEQLRQRLTGYFTEMMDLLLAERATLDKFIGDAIMVYFGCPIPDPQHPMQACRAALAMQQRMRELNRQWREAGEAPLRTRIGINTGLAVAGNLGTTTIFNYTIIGDCVNLASRLEAVNKEYGTGTIIGEDTWSRVEGRVAMRELDWIRVKGKVQPVAIYELAGPAGQLSPVQTELHARFAEGLTRYRQRRWHEAESAFRAALHCDPQDGPSATFLRRCAHYAAHPPEHDWDGVHVMQIK